MRHELFCTGYGFIVDYLAEVLKHLRTEDHTGLYKSHFEISSEVSTRDQTGFEKTFSGLMKIIHPDGKATSEEMAELLDTCQRRSDHGTHARKVAIPSLRWLTTPQRRSRASSGGRRRRRRSHPDRCTCCARGPRC